MPTITPEQFEVLLQHCGGLLGLADRWLSAGTVADDGDHLAFMAVTFAMKQRLHFESMGVLASARCFADLATLARTMLDGLTVLKWAAQRPDERALAWRAFALVYDYRLVEERRGRGETVDPAHEAELLRRLDEHGGRFLKRNARPESRDYRSRWAVSDAGKPITVEQMLADVGAGALYDLYDEWSGWLHWTARGIGPGLHRTDTRVAFAWNTEAAAAAPLAAGFQALAETLAFLDDHLALGRRAEIDAAVAAYLEALRPRAADPRGAATPPAEAEDAGEDPS